MKTKHNECWCESRRCGVYMQVREPAQQGGVCPQAKLMRSWTPSSRRVSQQPVGTVGRAPEEESHQRDDQCVVRACDGERDRVKSYMSKAWTEEASTRTRQLKCMKLSSNIVNTMTGQRRSQRDATVFNNPLQFNIQGCGAQPKTHDIIIACDLTDKESLNSVKDWTGEIRQACHPTVSTSFSSRTSVQCAVCSRSPVQVEGE